MSEELKIIKNIERIFLSFRGLEKILAFLIGKIKRDIVLPNTIENEEF
jgi:hypothetical protein